MTGVHDGLIAVSSDMIIYLFKFHYQGITDVKHINLEDLEDETLDEHEKFVDLIWKADM